MVASGWLAHSTRAVLTGLRKKGHSITWSKRSEVTCFPIAKCLMAKLDLDAELTALAQMDSKALAE